MTSADDPRENDDYAANLPDIYTCNAIACGETFESEADLETHIDQMVDVELIGGCLPWHRFKITAERDS